MTVNRAVTWGTERGSSTFVRLVLLTTWWAEITHLRGGRGMPCLLTCLARDVACSHAVTLSPLAISFPSLPRGVESGKGVGISQFVSPTCFILLPATKLGR